MKRFIAIATAAMLLFSFQANAQKSNKNKNIEEVTFSVALDCPSCVKKIEESLPFESGIKDIKVDMNAQTVWVKFDVRKTNKSKIASAIEKLGFAVSGEKTIQCKDGKCTENQCKDGQCCKEDKCKDGKCKDGQCCKEDKCKDGKCKDGQCKDGQCKDGKCKDSQCKDGHCKDGKCKDGQCKDGKCKKSEDTCNGDCSTCENEKCVK